MPLPGEKCRTDVGHVAVSQSARSIARAIAAFLRERRRGSSGRNVGTRAGQSDRWHNLSGDDHGILALDEAAGVLPRADVTERDVVL